MKNIIRKILFPNNIIGFILFNLGYILLIYVFSCHLEETPLAYISYLLSTYALIIFCLWFLKACKFSNRVLKESKAYQIYQKNFLVVIKTSIYFSTLLNLIYGLFKLGIGIYYQSWRFITFSIYYLLLSFIRVTLAKNIDNPHKEYFKLKHTGIILLLLNLILVGIIILIIKQKQIIDYKGSLIYLIAFYDFYLIISAVINVFKYQKKT